MADPLVIPGLEQLGGRSHPIASDPEEPKAPRARALELPPGEELPEELEELVEYFQERPDVARRVKLSLEEHRGGGWEHLATLESLEEATLENIRELYGGGRYRVRFRHQGTIVRAPQVRIGGPRRPREGEGAPDPQGRRLEELMAKVLEKLSERPPAGAPSADIVGLATALTAAQAPILAALAENNRPETPNMAEMIDSVARLIELGRESKGGDYGDVVRDFGVPLLGILNRGVQGQEGALEAPGALPAPNPAPGGQEAPQGAPGWYTALRPALPQLLQLAALRGDVEYWTGQLLERATDAQLEWIHAELERRDQFEEEFYRWVPQAVPHRAWFSRLWEELADQLEEEEEEEPEPELEPENGRRPGRGRRGPEG